MLGSKIARTLFGIVNRNDPSLPPASSDAVEYPDVIEKIVELIFFGLRKLAHHLNGNLIGN